MRFPDDARRLLILLIAFTVAATDCQAQQPSPFYQSPGTKKMAELLQKIYRENDWKADPNKPAERAAYYKSLLTQNLKPKTKSWYGGRWPANCFAPATAKERSMHCSSCARCARRKASSCRQRASARSLPCWPSLIFA